MGGWSRQWVAVGEHVSEDETKMVAEIAKQSISGDICDGDGDGDGDG